MSIKAVVFDIGWVLIEWWPERVYDQLIGEDRRKALFAEVPLSEANEAVDLGAPFAATFENLAKAHPQWAEEILLWPKHWCEFVSPEIPHSVRLLHALRAKGIPVFALSNFGDETFDIGQSMYPFFTEFDRRYISGRLKVMKPDPAIYEIVEKDSGMAPAEMIFTDDRQDNIDAAAARGWHTHLFEGPEGFAARLVAEGLLTEEEAQ